jgi:hypothetical protein
LSLKSLGLPKNRIIGMGGALDSSRFKYFLSQALGCNANEVEGMVIGGHGDTTMIPLARLATYKGIPVSKLLSAEKLQEVVASTMVGGATLTKLLGTSAWYAPGAAGAFVVESIIHNQGKMVPCSVYLEGEYGESDLCIGVYFLLAKLALNAEVFTDNDWTDGLRPNGREIYFRVGERKLNAWQTVVAYCDSITDLNYSLSPNYADNFSVFNESSGENIFTIPMDKNLYTSQTYRLNNNNTSHARHEPPPHTDLNRYNPFFAATRLISLKIDCLIRLLYTDIPK